MYFCLVLLLGTVAPFMQNVDLLPQAKERFIIVSANYQGARAKEVRRLVTIPLEENLASLKGIKKIESLSRDGLSVIKIELKWNVDCDLALLETKALLDAAADFLPQDCPKPAAQKAPESDEKAIKILVIPKNQDIVQASAFVKQELLRRALALEESGGAKCLGLVEPQIKIVVDSNLSSYYGLSLEQIAQELSLSNFDYPAGSIEDGENDILLKTEGSFKNFDDILETNLKTNEGPLKLKHLAGAKKAQKDFDSFCLYNGQECGALLVFCKNGQSPLKLSKKIKALLEEIKSENPNYDFVIETDSSKEIRRTIKSLAANALLGTAIAVLLLFLFFKSARISLAVGAVIPLSLLFSCLVLLAFKRSLNIISISGMTICLGMVVDNSIVALQGAIGRNADKDYPSALQEAFMQARLSNTASTLTSAIVFVPLFFIGGIIGELFLDLAISVMSGLMFSLIYSFGVLPAICARFLKEELQKVKTMNFGWLEKHRERILKKTNKIRLLCPALALAFTLAGFLILLPIKKEFQPKMRESFFCQKIIFPTGTDIKLMQSKTKAICFRIQEMQGVQSVFAQGGYEKDDLNFLANAENKKECVVLKIKTGKIKKCKKAVKEILDNFGLDNCLQESKDLISERLEISNNFLFCAGEEGDEESLLDECERTFGRDFFPHEMSEQKIFKENQKLMEKVKITPYQLAETLRKAFDGAAASGYFENGREIPMTVQFKEKECSSQDKLDRLKIILGTTPLELSALGEWKTKKEEAALFRHDGKDSKIISAKTAAAAPKEIKKRLVSIQAKGLKSLFLNGTFLLLLVLALLYCVLGAQTESTRMPLYYFTALPPSFFGAAAALFIFGSSLNINSIIAFMLLFGTAVNNSIILHESGGKNLSSVLITSATSIASLLPFAFDPLGINPQSSLSLAVAGGLAFSTAAVLIMVPNILHWRKNDF